jgi:hypothetical protein
LTSEYGSAACCGPLSLQSGRAYVPHSSRKEKFQGRITAYHGRRFSTFY